MAYVLHFRHLEYWHDVGITLNAFPFEELPASLEHVVQMSAFVYLFISWFGYEVCTTLDFYVNQAIYYSLYTHVVTPNFYSLNKVTSVLFPNDP